MKTKIAIVSPTTLTGHIAWMCPPGGSRRRDVRRPQGNGWTRMAGITRKKHRDAIV